LTEGTVRTPPQPALADASRSLPRRIVTLPYRFIRSTIGLIVNPIFLKELTVSSRRQRTYWLRATYLLLLVLALLLTWWVMAQGSMTESATEMLMRQSETGQGLSLTLVWIQLVALLLIAPMLTGSCISDEIEDRSLDVLLITPLTAGQIIVGKMLSRFVYVLLLVALGFPLLLAMRTYGGFTLEQLVQLEVLGLTSALLGASVAMFLSCREARGWRAVAMTYFWLAIWWFALPLILVAGAFLAVSLIQQFWPWLSTDSWYLDWEAYPFLMMHNNPVMAMGLLSLEMAGGSPMAWPTHYAWIFVNAINVGMSAILLLLAVPLLRRTANKRHGAGEERAVRWLTRLLRPRRRAAAVAVASVSSAPPIDPPSPESVPPVVQSPRPSPVAAPRADLPVPRVWDNAILWREMRFGFVRRPIATAFISLLVLGLLIWYNLEAELRLDTEMLIPIILLALLAQLMIACVVSPTVAASEKQARSWEVLLCVPIKPLTILWSKCAGSLKITLIPLAVIVLEMIFYSTRHPFLLLAALQVAVISLAFTIFLACTGCALSLLCKRSITAMAANLALAITLWGILPAIVGILSELRGWGFRTEETIGMSMVINPFYWTGVVCDRVGSSPYDDVPSYRLLFWDASLTPGEFTALTLLVAAITIGAGFGLLYACSIWFNRVTGRSS